MSSAVDKLNKLAEMFSVQAVSVITEVEDTPTANSEVRTYLNDKKYNWLTVLSKGEILFYFDPEANDIIQHLEELENVKSAMRSRGILPTLRPCMLPVIQHFIAQTAPTRQIRKTHQLKAVTEDTADEIEARTETQHLLDNIIDAAYKAGTSDIHIETDELNNTSTFKFRVDGKLIVQRSQALQLSERLVTRLASMIIGHEAHTGGGSTSDTFDKNRPIGGSFTVKTQTRTVKLRYSHMPTSEPKGLSIVMRIVNGDGKGVVPSFKDLDYSASEIALLNRIFRYPHGIILFTGPTGSGKSTAMNAGTRIIPNTSKVISFEDPVESLLPNVCQVQIGNNDATSYSAYSRTALRQDPDVIIYGEIRDEDVMASAIDQANTGHLVLSTLHTNTPADAIQRLMSLGSDVTVLANGSLIRAIVGQRLVPRLCPDCSLPLSEAVKEPWATEEHRRVYKYFSDNYASHLSKIRTARVENNKCRRCKGIGEKGRAPLVEIIMLDTVGREFIKEKDIDGWLAYLRRKGWKDLRAKAAARICAGTICPLSAEAILESAFGINLDEFDYDAFDQMNAEILDEDSVNENL